MNKKVSAWDEKSKKYFTFDGNLTEFQKIFFNKMKEFDVNFSNKTLIDIGCGNGMYSLQLAKNYCYFVTGVDSSSGMLDELNKCAIKFNIQNIKTIRSSFDDFETKEKFDIAFSTMSPAINSYKTFEKFYNLGNLKVYMNWNKERKSSMLDPFFYEHKRDLSSFMAASNLIKWLYKNLIKYKTDILEEVRIEKRSIEDACESVSWHLGFNEIKYSKEDIRNMILLQAKNGVVEDIISSSMRIIIF